MEKARVDISFFGVTGVKISKWRPVIDTENGKKIASCKDIIISTLSYSGKETSFKIEIFGEKDKTK